MITKTTCDDVKLDSTQIKCLLQYVEFTNVPHDSINLKSICDKNPAMFGGRDTQNPLRRAFQTKWNHQLDKSYVNRKKYWDQHEVPFNAANQSIYEQELETGFILSDRARRRAARSQRKTSFTPQASNMTQNLSSPPPKSIDKPVADADEVTTVTSGLSSLNVGNNKEDDVDLAPVYNVNTSNSSKSGGFIKSLFGKSPARHFGSPSIGTIGSAASPPPPTSLSVAVTRYSYNDPLSFPRGEASLEHPQVIVADIHFPERNYPFMLHRVAKMLLNDYAAEGYHLGLNVEPNDVMRYSSYMATVDGQPNRGVLVRAPSATASQVEKDQVVKGLKCSGTQTTYNHNIVLMQQNEARKYRYFLILLEETLDNSIFSGSHTTITAQYQGIESTFENGTKSTSSKMAMINWYIAVAGTGGKIKSTESVTPLTLFA